MINDAQYARILLALLRGRREDLDVLAAAGPVDPEAFVALTVECDVPSLTLARIRALGAEETFDDEVIARLESIRAKVRLDNMLLLGRAEQGLDALLAAGVVPVGLKGLDLLHRVYDRIDERTMDDVDLLIDEPQLPDALMALRQAGWTLPPEAEARHYVRSSHHLPISSPGPISVEFELHWNLAQETRFNIDGRALLDRSQPLDVAGRTIRRLEDHDFVAHLLLHHFTHYFDRRLKWAVDLHAVARRPGFDWGRVAGRVREWEATAVCSMALRQLAKQFPEWIPDDILRALPVAAWRNLVTRPLRSSHPLDLFRNTDNRGIRRYLAAALLEHPTRLPGWVFHRATRDRRQSDNPLDGTLLGAGSEGDAPDSETDASAGGKREP